MSDVAVLFDMDGLLIDSEPLWLEAETAVMARLGTQWTEADQRQLSGRQPGALGELPCWPRRHGRCRRKRWPRG